MKTTKAAIVLAAVLGSSMVATGAEARHGGRHGHHGHHHHGHRSSVGIFFAVPAPVYYYPRYYPRYYYPPTVVAAPAPVYIEQSPPAAAPAPSQSSTAYWYYCRDTQTYYPYVQQCASPWQQIVPNSAPPS